jgi:DNA-binding MarR family transcriptional regulator
MSPDDQELAAALTALYREIGGLHGAVGRRHGLTTAQARLLCLMTRQRPSFGELAGLLGCDKTNVTGMVDRLRRRGLLRRETDPDDRRVGRVVVTDEGAALMEVLRAELADAMAQRLRTWHAADRDQLMTLARAAAENFAQGRGSTPKQ